VSYDNQHAKKIKLYNITRLDSIIDKVVNLERVCKRIFFSNLLLYFIIEIGHAINRI
jgi:hypothetical protein